MNPPRVIAECGPADGSFTRAITMAEAAHEAGAWAAKFQIYHPDRLVAPLTPTYGHFELKEPATQNEAFANPLDYSLWPIVKAACDEIGIVFFASVFDSEGVDLLSEMGCEYVKIASADITNKPLIEQAARTEMKVILSTGGATEAEVRAAHAWCHDRRSVPILMACSLEYPTPIERANVNRITSLRKLGVVVGYSDHTRDEYAALAATALGAGFIEKHFTLTPGAGGDHNFAATPLVLERYITKIEMVAAACGSSSLSQTDQELETIKLARRALYLDPQRIVVALRPALDGVPPSDLHEYQTHPERFKTSDVEGGYKIIRRA